MLNLYDKNGLVFWTETEIKLRRIFEEIFSSSILFELQKQNSAFHMVQMEAPLLTPKNLINPNYTDADTWSFDELVLRPETTMGSYEYAKILLSGYSDVKYRPPLVVFQHGKSFRREADHPSKFMRLKEFYQLEFQIIFAKNTMNDYSVALYPAVCTILSNIVDKCHLEKSERLPDYSEETIDVICERNSMELCSMSKRKDFENYKVIEIAIGTDRCVACSNWKL